MVKCMLTADSIPADAPPLHLGKIRVTSVHLQDVGLVGVDDGNTDVTFPQNEQADEMQALGLPTSFTATRISSQPGGKRQRRKRGSPTVSAGKDATQLPSSRPGTPRLPGSPLATGSRGGSGAGYGGCGGGDAVGGSAAAAAAAPPAASAGAGGGSTGAAVGGGGSGAGGSGTGGSGGQAGRWSGASAAAQVEAGLVPPGQAATGDRQAGDQWMKVLDPETDCHYYYNPHTQVSQWEAPDTTTDAPPAPTPSQPEPAPPAPSESRSPPPSSLAPHQATPPTPPSPTPAPQQPPRSYLSIASAPPAAQPHPAAASAPSTPPTGTPLCTSPRPSTPPSGPIPTPASHRTSPPAPRPSTTTTPASGLTAVCAAAVLAPAHPAAAAAGSNGTTKALLAASSYAAVVAAVEKLEGPYAALAGPCSWPPTTSGRRSLEDSRSSIEGTTTAPPPATTSSLAAQALALVAGAAGGAAASAGPGAAVGEPAAAATAAGGGQGPLWVSARGAAAAALRLKLPRKVQRYFLQRYSLFTLYDQGVEMDDEGWFSVTPEVLAAHQARRCAAGVGVGGGGGVVVDAFAGCGGNMIQLAKIFEHVIGVEISAERAGMVRRNAAVYGVGGRVDVVVGDFFRLAPDLAADVLFMSPPWGGPDYKYCGAFDPLENIPGLGASVAGLVEVARGVVERGGRRGGGGVAVFLPRNLDLVALGQVVPEGEVWEVERAFLNGRLKGVTLYCGALANTSEATGGAATAAGG